MRLNGAGTWWPWALVAAGILVFIPFTRYELRRDGSAGGYPDAAQQVHVAGPADRRTPVRCLCAGRPGPAVHLRPDRPRPARLRPGAARRAGLHHHRRLRAGAAGGRAAVPGGDPPAHPALDARGRRRARGRWAICCSCRSTAASPRRWPTWRSPASAPAPSLRRCPPAAAAAAPLNRTAMATGLTNTTKTIGGAFASAVFGIALLSHVLGRGRGRRGGRRADRGAARRVPHGVGHLRGYRPGRGCRAGAGAAAGVLRPRARRRPASRRLALGRCALPPRLLTKYVHTVTARSLEVAHMTKRPGRLRSPQSARRQPLAPGMHHLAAGTREKVDARAVLDAFRTRGMGNT